MIINAVHLFTVVIVYLLMSVGIMLVKKKIADGSNKMKLWKVSVSVQAKIEYSNAKYFLHFFQNPQYNICVWNT